MNRSITKLDSSSVISPRESPNKIKTVYNYKKTKPSTYIMDPLIIRRVEEYMNEHKESRYLDIDEMVDELQNKYREYSRRKRIAFKSCVLKAFNIVMNDVDNGHQTSEESADSDKDIDVVKVTGGREMYLKYTFNKKNKPREEKELIKISSDEEEKERPPRPVAPPPAATPLSSLRHVEDITVTPASEVSKKRKNGDPIITKAKKRPKEYHVPNEKFADFGGLDDAIKKKIFKHASQVLVPDSFKEGGRLGRRRRPPGFLIYGPHGSGKSFFTRCLAGQLQLPLITASELIGGISGESERRIRSLFEDAEANAPCVLFFDNIDSLAGRQDQTQRDMSRRILAQISKSIDELGPGVAVVGASCFADSIDPSLRRAGRLAVEVSLGMPNRDQREEILKVVFRGIQLESDIQLSKIAELTPGFVACDLEGLAEASYNSAFERALGIQWPEKEGDECLTGEEFKELIKPEEIDTICITQKDVESALAHIEPSALREGFTTVPDVTWDDIGSLEAIRNKLHHQIIEPIRNHKVYANLGLSTPAGLLLCGPPGCGKTLIAKAVAKQSGYNFISVKGPELLNMYLGESERAVRQVFERARHSSPCVIFFDEIDALCPIRGNLSHDASARLVTQMLTEMDGLVARKEVFVLAATNRPELVDRAILRPGRLDKTIFVDLPKAEERADILKALTRKKPPLESDVDLVEIGQDPRTEGYSGADLAALVKEAASNAVEDLYTEHGYQIFKETPKVKKDHFYRAFTKIKPSVSKEDYEKMKNKFQKMNQHFATSPSPIFKDTQVNGDISTNLKNETCQSNDNKEQKSDQNEDNKDYSEQMDINE